MLNALIQQLNALANPTRALQATRFFKTAKGQYAEGDIFIGISNPALRTLAKSYQKTISLDNLQLLLNNEIHEFRLIALFILVAKFQKSSANERVVYVDFYLNNVEKINNWDLVDSSAYQILGNFLLHENRQILYDLASSKHLWSERIAIVATLAFIREQQFLDCFNLSALFFKHPHDLMHKACGWMLREVGKRNTTSLEEFLEENVTLMPRTMLRYAIEKFPEPQRQYFLKAKPFTQ